MRRLRDSLNRAAAAAATLTGTRFNLLVAASLVATTAVVASALTGTGDSGALAALLGQRPSSAATVAPAVPSSASAESSAPAAAPPAAPATTSGALVSTEAPVPAPPEEPAPAADEAASPAESRPKRAGSSTSS